MQLRPHQLTALEKMHNGSVLTGGVGTGKTITALYYAVEKEMCGKVGDRDSIKNPRDIYVFTTARKRDTLDWQEAAFKLGITRDRELSVGGIQLVVDSYNNIIKYSQITDAFIILDEQRMVGSGAWTKTFLRMAKNNRWIMLSATPGDTWMDYIPLFVANGFYKNRTEFKRRHVVYNTFSKFPKVDHFVEIGTLNKHRLSILVEMPYERHTKRHLTPYLVDYDEALFERVVKQRWNPYEERPLKDVAELFSVMRKVVNSDSSRIEALRSLMQTHPRIIVFYNFDYELLNLRSLVSGITVAEWNGHKHEPVPQTERWVYLVQYVAGAEAWECIDTDTVAFYSLTYSYKIFEQSQGRIDRLNTPFSDLWYYILMSNSPIDKVISKALRNKQTFSENKYYRD